MTVEFSLKITFLLASQKEQKNEKFDSDIFFDYTKLRPF